MLITDALCALSLRAIQTIRQPHISEDEIRQHHAMSLSLMARPRRTGKVHIFNLPRPSTASLSAMSSFFEAKCTPEDLREARLDRDSNNRHRREALRKVKGAAYVS